MNNSKYDDIINLPHHVSNKHKPMSIEMRAAQFAPFAALTGYDDAINETARQTNARIEINEELKKILDIKLQEIYKQILKKPTVTFTYFVPDLKKEGGEYVKVTGRVKKIDKYRQMIVLEDKKEISIEEIVEIIEKTGLE